MTGSEFVCGYCGRVLTGRRRRYCDRDCQTDAYAERRRRPPLMRCPFVRAVAECRLDDARDLATAPPDPAEPAVLAWLIAEARRQLDGVA